MKARLLAVAAGLLGLGLAIWLILFEGVSGILGVLEASGWVILWLIPLHIVPVALDTGGWQALLRPFDRQRHATFPFLSWVAGVREAVDRLLPVANVGGQIIGIRLLLLRPLSVGAAATSVLVDVLLNIVTRYLFTALGLVLLIALVHDSHTINVIIAGLVVTLPMPIALYFLLRNGRLFDRVKHAVLRLLGSDHRIAVTIADSAAELDDDLATLLRMHKPLIKALAWQFAAMVFSGVETWVALRLLGSPVSLGAALALESLASVVRDVAFFVPGAIGVQEASFVGFGALLGLPADVMVALSLVKRLRDIGFGIPLLLSWQGVETRRLRAERHPHATDTTQT
ncbi:MAG TPA: lysylphosphatidylglycerol synthase domain-containing protein [Rhodanobacteraceae bacterium]